MVRLITTRLSYKVAVGASALTLFVVLVTGSAAYVVMSSLIRGQASSLLQAEAGMRAEKIADLLDGVTANFRTLAANPVVADGLADGGARELYLKPLLRNFAEVNRLPISVALCDVKGRPLVAAGDAAVGADHWVEEAVATGRARTRVGVERGGPVLTVAEPVAGAGPGAAPGALVYRIALADLGRRAAAPSGGGELILRDHGAVYSVDLGRRNRKAGLPLASEADVRLPDILGGIRLSVLVGAEADMLDIPLARLTSAFVAIGLGTTLLVILVSAVLGQRLTATVRQLSAAASGYAFGRDAPGAFRVMGDDEIARLGEAFAGMVERLNRAYKDLERHSQTVLSNAERVAQVGSAVWDLGSGRQVWSDQFHAVLALDPADTQPGESAFFDRVHPDDRTRLSAALDGVMSGVAARLTEDFRIVRADGVERFAQLRAQASPGDDGHVVRVDLTLQDITDRKHMEEKLDALVSELRRSNEELEQFAYVASHDLRQPLRVVGSYVTLIEEAIEDKLDPETREFMDFIRDGVRRMDLLITDLLAYSRVGRTSRDGPVDTGRALDLALMDLQVEIDEARAAVEHPDRMPVVLGDAGEMTRLFQNLVGNAVKYRSPERRSHVTIGCLDEGGGWHFWVRDNGIGIPPEHADRVFGIFQRLHARDEYEGTGIGLAICKKVVERQGGRIWIETRAGEGTTFHFTWPKMRRSSEAGSSP